MNEHYETLELRRDTDLLWLVLNRPAALNAMNSLLVNELHTVLDELRQDQTVRVVILRGAGRGFCAGLDLKQSSAATGTYSVGPGPTGPAPDCRAGD